MDLEDDGVPNIEAVGEDDEMMNASDPGGTMVPNTFSNC